MVSETTPVEDSDSMLVLESSSEDEEVQAAAVMNELALHSVQHRARLLQPVQGNHQVSMSDNLPLKESAVEPSKSITKQVENEFFARFDKADVSINLVSHL